MTARLRMTSYLLAAAWTLTASGCGGGTGPGLASVEGTVTLDGSPLPDATVVFQPKNGRPSSGETNSDGYYELYYKADTPGAVLGQHRVSISTYREGDADAEDAAGRTGRPELVPDKYNTETTLTAEVKSSNSPFDFDLDPKGKITNPDQDNKRRRRSRDDCGGEVDEDEG